MKFTFVATCFNEIKSLDRWLADMSAQTRQPDEIIITDARSTDGTTERLKQWEKEDSRVHIVIQKCNAARGRNIAISKANYDHIVITDMGVTIDPHWFEEIVQPFEDDPTVDIVLGAYAVDKNSIRSSAARAEYYVEGDGYPFTEDENGHIRPKPGVVPSNRSVAYTKKVWQELDGLPEDLTFYADDSVFGSQMLAGGYRIAYAPKAMVYWHRFQYVKQFWKEQYGYGIGNGECALPNKTPFAVILYRKGLLFKAFVPLVHGFRILQKQIHFRAIIQALRKADFTALLLMPILYFGNGYHNARGYLVGEIQGALRCQDCRDRVAKLSATPL